MLQYDEEEEELYELIGHIRKRGDESRSPSPTGHRRNRMGERRPSTTSNDDHTLLHTRPQVRMSQSQSSSKGQDNPSKPLRDGSAVNHIQQQPPQDMNPNAYLMTGCLKVKTPSDDEDLSEKEYQKYQDRFGFRHKILARQIIQGTLDDEAQDPTLGNRRCQYKLDQDGTVDRQDFDPDGCFKYSQPRDSRPQEKESDNSTASFRSLLALLNLEDRCWGRRE